MTVVQFLTVLFTYPETKGQTLEALQRKLVAAAKIALHDETAMNRARF